MLPTHLLSCNRLQGTPANIGFRGAHIVGHPVFLPHYMGSSPIIYGGSPFFIRKIILVCQKITILRTELIDKVIPKGLMVTLVECIEEV